MITPEHPQYEKIERIEEPEVNRSIVYLFLEKLELMTDEERKTIIKTIQILNHPVFTTSSEVGVQDIELKSRKRRLTLR